VVCSSYSHTWAEHLREGANYKGVYMNKLSSGSFLKPIVVLVSVFTLSIGATGCGKGSNKNIKIDGVAGPYVNFVDGKLTMSVILTKVQFDYGTRIPVPYMPNSYLEVGPDFQSNGFMINIGMDPQDLKTLLKDNIALLDPQTLPGGRAIPGIAEGFLPSMALQVPKWDNLVFYAGANLFGLFVPVNLPWKDYMGTFRFYDGSNTPIGNISIVGKDSNNRNSGFLLLINLKGKVGQLMQM
jgi:hypothetical protein